MGQSQIHEKLGIKVMIQCTQEYIENLNNELG